MALNEEQQQEAAIAANKAATDQRLKRVNSTHDDVNCAVAEATGDIIEAVGKRLKSLEKKGKYNISVQEEITNKVLGIERKTTIKVEEVQ